ncbi:hypothetical protein C5167_005449 [Papaver somniferum]|uniref:Uncharacterized protein n=1 Tax=Papaver somniferum TaxID=3469 RepID=A0A4Y7JEG8_PAPSO|nr:hypothetical protein C5167_005449 [Papaver somniferum]
MQSVPTCLGLRTVMFIRWFSTLPLDSSLRGINEGWNAFLVLPTSSPACRFFGNFELIQHEAVITHDLHSDPYRLPWSTFFP